MASVRRAIVAILLLLIAASIATNVMVERPQQSHDVANCDKAFVVVYDHSKSADPTSFSNLTEAGQNAVTRAIRNQDPSTELHPEVAARLPQTVTYRDATYRVEVQGLDCPVVAGMPSRLDVLFLTLKLVYDSFSGYYPTLTILLLLFVSYRGIIGKIQY